MSIRGSCLCGGITYKVDRGGFGRVVNCHCSMCRKATGAAFRTRASVLATTFHWLSGESLLSRYESSPGETRTFCSICGATLATFFRDRPDHIGLALGTLDEDPGVKPSAHVYVDSKAAWFEITDELPCFAGVSGRTSEVPVRGRALRGPNMNIDRQACDEVWRAYLSLLPPDHPHHDAKPDAFAIGNEPELADELAALVLSGQKRATTSLPVEFTSLTEALPKVGDASIILRGDGFPVAIIERTAVDAIPFDSVDDVYAAIEGEGDASLEHWRAAHNEYFNGVCARLGGHFDGQTPVICQVFRVVWKSPGGA